MNAHPLQVKLTKDARTVTTRLVLPKGTTGRVVGLHVDDSGKWDVYLWQIDFGIPTIVALPYDSPLIQVVNRNGVEK